MIVDIYNIRTFDSKLITRYLYNGFGIRFMFNLRSN